MKRLLAGVLGAGAIAFSGAASAEWSLNAGFEGFDWKESTSPAVKESGLRWTVGLSYRQSKEPGLSFGYDLKIYNGNVDYDGAGLFTGVPISDETHYRGAVNELQAIYRMPNGFAVVLAAGYDFWKRELNNPGQREDWKVVYGKLGGSYGETMKQGFIGSAGIKYPVWTRENANLQDQLGTFDNPRIRPGKDISLYATAGWRFSPSWDLIAYYDSYRFDRSNDVAVSGPGFAGTVFQPESKMDVYGVKLQYNIQ